METNSIISQIGNTPLVRLKQASELTGCNILRKAEYFNPESQSKIEQHYLLLKMQLKKENLFRKEELLLREQRKYWNRLSCSM